MFGLCHICLVFSLNMVILMFIYCTIFKLCVEIILIACEYFSIAFGAFRVELFHGHGIFPLFFFDNVEMGVFDDGILVLIIGLQVFLVDLPDFKRNVILFHLFVHFYCIRVLLELFA